MQELHRLASEASASVRQVQVALVVRPQKALVLMASAARVQLARVQLARVQLARVLVARVLVEKFLRQHAR